MKSVYGETHNSFINCSREILLLSLQYTNKTGLPFMTTTQFLYSLKANPFIYKMHLLPLINTFIHDNAKPVVMSVKIAFCNVCMQ
jgi:hypothetical protein